MSLLTDASRLVAILTDAVANRRLRREIAQILRERGPLAEHTFEVVLFFSDPAVNLYQVRQWYEPMRRLAEQHPVVVVSRSFDSTRVLLDECPVPVYLSQNMSALEEWLTTQPARVFFYVNQNIKNFSAIRFAEPAHVFVSHGESDKAYMASNQLKAYDAVFVAGQAAVDRITSKLYDVDTARLVTIGRPQVDVVLEGPPLPRDGRTVVLYAPTWEGDRPSMSYSSVASHGPALVAALAATGRHRVVYRPHPRTGAFDASYRKAHLEIAAVIEAANAADPAAGHLLDVGTEFGWHLTAADACVCDISAVAFDWLATGKPLVLTAPVAESAVVDPDGIARAVPLLPAHEAHLVVERLDELTVTGRDQDYDELVRHYFGDTTPGASMQRFLDGATLVIERRRALQEARAAALATTSGTAEGADG